MSQFYRLTCINWSVIRDLFHILPSLSLFLILLISVFEPETKSKEEARQKTFTLVLYPCLHLKQLQLFSASRKHVYLLSALAWITIQTLRVCMHN